MLTLVDLPVDGIPVRHARRSVHVPGRFHLGRRGDSRLGHRGSDPGAAVPHGGGEAVARHRVQLALRFGWLISISVQRLTCPRQPRFRASHRAGIRPVIPGRPAEGPGTPPWVSCCLSATGVRFLGILSRQRVSALLTVGLPGNAWTLAGFPRSAHPSHGRIGCPLYPEAQRCSHGRSYPSGRRLPPLPGARPYHPGVHPTSRSYPLRGVIKGSLAFTRPAFPLACWSPDGTRTPWARSRASHPGRQDLPAHAG